MPKNLSAFVLLSVLILALSPLKADAAYIQKYYEGQVLSFTLADKRFACSNVSLVRDFIKFVRQEFKEDAVGMFWKPLERKSIDGTLILNTKISERLANMSREVRQRCGPAPSKVIVLKAYDYIEVGDTDDRPNEAVITLVADVNGKLMVIYFMNIRVLSPEFESKQAERLEAVWATIIRNKSSSSSPAILWR
jgi:hypothetical protein